MALVPLAVIALLVVLSLAFGNFPVKIGLVHWYDAVPVAQHQARPDPTAVHRKPDPYPVQTVADPWQPGQTQWGIQVYWQNTASDPPSYTWGKAQRIVNYVVSLDANSLCISFPFYTPDITASTVGAKPTTPSPARVAILIQEARRAGLRVTVRPILNEASLDPPTGWRGAIEPADPAEWFASYQRLLLPYAQVAQKYGAATFTVGTELDSMEGDPHWAGLIAAVGRVFHGQISYDINWSDYITTPQVDVPVGSFGVDAYFPVDAPDSAPVSELVAGWDAWLDHKTTGPLRSLVFSEVAIGAEDGAYESPGNFYVSNPYNPNVQANWYTAICTVTRQRQMAGMYVWSLDFNAVPDHPPRSESPLDFLGRPLSEQALRACFSGELASADAHTGLPGGQHIEISRYGDPLRHRSTVP
jgi:hypothetical protein